MTIKRTFFESAFFRNIILGRQFKESQLKTIYLQKRRVQNIQKTNLGEILCTYVYFRIFKALHNFRFYGKEI